MKSNLLFDFIVNKENKSIHVSREFDANLELVWKAWTTAEILDQWWAPKPWKAKTKSMDFNEGGHWLYAMVSPEGEKHWSKVNYIVIEKEEAFTAKDGFCDENGKMNPDFPQNLWENKFNPKGEQTLVNITLTFDTLEDLEKIIEMGFKEGFTMALENLDHYISTQFKLRKQNKPNNLPRVTTYLNFPGKTEEAFLFYKEIFNGEFTGVGLRRFGDVELPDGHPPMSNEDKKLIIHAELTIMAGHVLMATDSPESMGFKLEQGNNMHINLEPDSRKETKRLFDALSSGGNITMPLQDMFWGAYFGTVTDKYGINWMLNHQNK